MKMQDRPLAPAHAAAVSARAGGSLGGAAGGARSQARSGTPRDKDSSALSGILTGRNSQLGAVSDGTGAESGTSGGATISATPLPGSGPVFDADEAGKGDDAPLPPGWTQHVRSVTSAMCLSLSLLCLGGGGERENACWLCFCVFVCVLYS